MHKRILLALFCGVLAATSVAAAERRLVTIGAAVTEIVYLLEAGDDVIAVDATSVYPQAVHALPNVGYFRALSAEPIIALRPDLVLVTEGAGPPEALTQLRDAGVSLAMIPDEATVDGAAEKIRAVAAALGETTAGAERAEAFIAAVSRATAPHANRNARPKVLFVMQFDAGSLLAAGVNTAADSIIRLAGGTNAATGFDGYKPMAAEAVMAAAPDLVVTLPRAMKGFASPQDVLALPVLKLTPAAQGGRLAVMDASLVLGFGPRLDVAVNTLATAIHGAD